MDGRIFILFLIGIVYVLLLLAGYIKYKYYMENEL